MNARRVITIALFVICVVALAVSAFAQAKPIPVPTTPISKPPAGQKTICPEVPLEPEGHEHHSTGSGTGMVERHQATAAETFTLSRSTDISNDGGPNKCWCLHFVQVTASVILKMAC